MEFVNFGLFIADWLAEEKLISYLCKDSGNLMKRELIYSPEYIEFAKNSNKRTQEKLMYATQILRIVSPIPTKFVKKLIDTDFYEMRISVDNEIRVILLAAEMKT